MEIKGFPVEMKGFVASVSHLFTESSEKVEGVY